ncbi:hypothetical protein Pla123a_03920 [Posidoniimonas polymericola]|uniref:Uncharacterized protein n=1 Tax=Posidoniimonas polymericola TaxID=2528002 RepID=A0A5C5ZEK6_9BACT|nr:hypothetical protein [Posidoniimonas polymericola]TWT85585.1 hypothetical protein Pla123a_03920 [Posidoniimonas polymericola]
MANTMRWRYGATNPVVLAVDSATVIEIGDLVYLATDDARPAGDQLDQGTESLNQQTLHAEFAGVAMQHSAAGDTQPIRVATTGVFDFPCDAATFEVGDLIGPIENAAGDALENQKVKAVAGIGASVGRCAARAPDAATRVLVDVVSSLMRGGVQAVA